MFAYFVAVVVVVVFRVVVEPKSKTNKPQAIQMNVVGSRQLLQ